MLRVIFAICISTALLELSFVVPVKAESDPAVDSALTDTKILLKDPSKRKAVFAKDAKAKAADDNVQRVTGGNQGQNQKIYEISSDAFSSVMQSAGNDPAKAMELLQKAQANPEAFFNSLPKDTRDQIRGVAADIEAKGNTKNHP